MAAIMTVRLEEGSAVDFTDEADQVVLQVARACNAAGDGVLRVCVLAPYVLCGSVLETLCSRRENGPGDRTRTG